MYYSIWDLQCDCYLHSGRNSTTIQEASEDLVDYYYDGGDDWEYIFQVPTDQVRDYFLKLSLSELYALGEFRLDVHNDPIPDNYDEREVGHPAIVPKWRQSDRLIEVSIMQLKEQGIIK